MNGLDDLRGTGRKMSALFRHSQKSLGWTLHSAIQSHIDIYVTRHTFGEVQRSFPYLVSKEFASGGGDVSVAAG